MKDNPQSPDYSLLRRGNQDSAFPSSASNRHFRFLKIITKAPHGPSAFPIHLQGKKRRKAEKGFTSCRGSHLSSPCSLGSALSHPSNSQINPGLGQAGLGPTVCTCTELAVEREES